VPAAGLTGGTQGGPHLRRKPYTRSRPRPPPRLGGRARHLV